MSTEGMEVCTEGFAVVQIFAGAEIGALWVGCDIAAEISKLLR